MSLKLGILFSRIRKEEKLIIEEALRRGIEIVRVDSRQLIMSLNGNYDFDVLLERDVSHSRALYALNLFQGSGIKTINTYDVALICGDKVATTKALKSAGIPTPDVKVAFTHKTALKAIEEFGYPVVLKPVVGSWGRLLAKVNDRDAAEALLEHKEHLGSYYHSIFYIQKYIEKPERDIRAFVIGDETVCAIYRSSKHWITNTARGAEASNCPVTPELNDLCVRAAKAVGGGILAVDLMETKDGPVVNEINYTIEFRNSIEPSNVNIPALIIDYAIKVSKE
ncbi:MAG: lysine biosynthesis protein LysX [FCB group bacterium]|nr:lysine biosynthesis protein LysX [FCB group bacterium]